MEEIALGEMGMSIDEFWYSTPRSFDNKLKGYYAKRERSSQEQWELARYTAYCSLIVHIDSKRRQSMQSMLPLPWDKQQTEVRRITKEDTKKLLKKWQIAEALVP